ncbi:MAG: glycosyltransferase family 4 protein [Rhodothermales bacterium]
MHVLLVTQDFPPDVGGTQTWSAEIARGLVREGHAVTVVCPALSGDASVDASFRDAGVRVVRVAATYDAFPLRARRQLRSLLATASPTHAPPDVALAVAWPAALALRLAGAGSSRRVPVALAVHGRELLLEPLGFPGGRLLYDRLRRSAVRSADRFVPVSHYSASLLEPYGVPDSSVHVVNNGTDPEVFSPAREADQQALRDELGIGNRPMILSVCRLVGRKGVDTVIRALPRVLEAVPDAVYVVAGDGPDANALEALARGEGVEAQVVFAGRLPWNRLRACYSAAQVFALPARQADPDVEGFGIVFLEANACETPVIGALTGGIPDAIAEGESGVLVPPDDPVALADGLIRLLSDPEYANRMGRQGRQRVVDGFTWSHAAGRIARILEGMG